MSGFNAFYRDISYITSVALVFGFYATPIFYDMGTAAAIAEGEGPERYVVALGYAGWGDGQLEDEMRQNSGQDGWFESAGYDEERRQMLEVALKELPDRLAELPRDELLVVMCHHGLRSERVTRWLRANGFPRATNLAGGIDAWARTIETGLARY